MNAKGPDDPGPITLLEFVRAGQEWLARFDIPSARLEAELLLAHVLQVGRLDLYLEFERPLGKDEQDRYREFLLARSKGEPLAYLVGEREFYSLPFNVDSRVLIPRPESEILVDVALAAHPGEESIRFVDVCTGSGCVAIALLTEREQWQGFATDLSPKALEVAHTNRERHQLEDRLTLMEGDLLEPLIANLPPLSLDLVLANPPYVEEGDGGLDPEVRKHEPAMALFAGPAGVEALWIKLIRQAELVLKEGGLIGIECGAGQPPRLEQVLDGSRWEEVEVKSDLAGIPRTLFARKRCRCE